MHAVDPAIPPAIKARFEGYVHLDNPELVAASISQRSVALLQNITTAGGNLLIAQHRDTLCYARMRGGGTLPVLRRFHPGDYVYHHHNGARSNLDKPGIYHDSHLSKHPTSFGANNCQSYPLSHFLDSYEYNDG